MRKYILALVAILILVSTFYTYTLYDNKKYGNLEVVILKKIKNKNDFYLSAQVLNEVKDEASDLEDHTFIRNNKTMDNNGSIKSNFITKTWTNGPKFKIKVNSNIYNTTVVGTRMIFRLKYK